MKTLRNIYLTAILSLVVTGMVAAQTIATNFTANDCTGTSHTLFTELDAGKIIVIAWVMPCGSCAPPSLAAYNAVQSFASSNPNTVYFYLVDDIGDTPCSTLTTWGNTNSMPNAVKFSNPVIDMADYGTPGMPKIVVLGGTSHTIAYNLNSGVTQSGVTSAINGLLSTMGSNELNDENAQGAVVIPNPVSEGFTLKYSLGNEPQSIIEIINSSGQIILTQTHNTISEGLKSVSFGSELKLEQGFYIIRISNGLEVQTTTFVVE